MNNSIKNFIGETPEQSERKRLHRDNNILRKLLIEWHDLFAPVRKNNTIGAELIDKTQAVIKLSKHCNIGGDRDIIPSDPDRQRLTQEIQRLKTCLNTAAGLLSRLEQYGCIQTDDEQFEPELDHWRHIGRDVVQQARSLLDLQFDLEK